MIESSFGANYNGTIIIGLSIIPLAPRKFQSVQAIARRLCCDFVLVIACLLRPSVTVVIARLCLWLMLPGWLLRCSNLYVFIVKIVMSCIFLFFSTGVFLC